MFMSEGLKVKTVPGIDEIVDGQIDINALRPIKLEDLLGRDPVPPDKLLMKKAISGQVVLVTGAGGSIGSELVRQISIYAPQKIILVDNNEYSLFEIHREIETKCFSQNSKYELLALLADVQDTARMSEIISEHGITVVLHAAAYKHVRMVQENSMAGIRNNVWGTLAVAEAAVKNNVKLFILISTDKAVRPTSIMGASKRVAEMVVQALAKRKDSKTVFAIVRFGNVLGSTGSVIPLFQEQIMKGGPVVVTHKEVTRFFMLIPEAAQLVIQSGALAEKGEVFVLDMGESVKIVNLAETMIELAGMTVKSQTNPDGEIEIKFIGLRDGEKLYEELQIGRDVSTTSHERIMRSNEFFLPWPKLKTALNKIDDRSLTAKTRVEELFRIALLDS
jgi:FlaA1/EpsC-like NDP-sugar epimerase